MKLELTHPDALWSPRLQHLVERLSGDLGHRLARYELRGSLSARVNATDDGQTQVRLRLDLPDDEVFASDHVDDAAGAIRAAFRALFRSFDRYRIARGAALRAKNAARQGAGPRSWHRGGQPRAEVVALLRDRVVPALLRAAQHEIVLRQCEGSLEPGWLDPTDVVDEVVADHLGSISPDEAPGVIVTRLEADVVKRVDAAALEVERMSREEVSLTQSVSGSSPAMEVSTLGEDILDFWVLDEALSLEDLIEDPNAVNPEQLLEDHEARHVLIGALFQLPAEERRDFERVVLDGFTPAEVAEVAGCRTADVEARVATATQALSTSVASNGMDASSVRDLYRSMGRRLRQLGDLGLRQ